jgi:hypothetical protein
MTLPSNGVNGAHKSHLAPAGQWNLGFDGDPDRGILKDTRLSPGETIAMHHYEDWHMIAVLEGSLEVGGRRLGRDGILRVAPGSAVPNIRAGQDGAHLLEAARTAIGLLPCFAPATAACDRVA